MECKNVWLTKDKLNVILQQVMARKIKESQDYKDAVMAGDIDWISESLSTLEASGCLKDDSYKLGIFMGINNMLMFQSGTITREEAFEGLMSDLDIAGEIMYKEYQQDRCDIEWEKVMKDRS